MAALVQSFPSPSSTLTMLQTRSSSTEPFQNGSQSQQHQRNSHMPRNIYNTSVGGMVTGNYRGHTSISPVAPYAFTTTPNIPNNANPLQQHPIAPLLRQENRTSSAPTIPFAQQTLLPNSSNSNRNRPTGPSFSSPLDVSVAPPLVQQSGSKDDASISSSNYKQNLPRPLSSIELIAPTFSAPTSYANAAKPSPDRYRRNHRRVENSGAQITSIPSPGGSASPSGSGMATVGHLYSNPLQSNSTPTLTSYPAFRGSSQLNSEASGLQPRVSSVDDMNLPRQSAAEQAKRYRRRSISSLEVKEHTAQLSDNRAQAPLQTKTYAAMLAGPASQDKKETPPLVSQRPPSSHGRNDSGESSNSSRSVSRPSSSKREGPATTAISPAALQATPIAKNEAKLVNIPPRGSSDANKRLANPSPLSKPLAMSPANATSKDSFATLNSEGSTITPHTTSNPPHSGIPESPAAQHLAALNKKDGKKEGKSSRLRRAFSFGSAAELRKASAENNMNNHLSNERAKLRKDRYQNEHDAREAEQAAIAQKQEAAGLGQGIYSGQGHFYTGSTDNLSISSTASSASVMIRKMGQGMKKGSRSLVGLFRPKSIVGVPAAEPAVPEPSIAQVSMVTVEAEREKVNVNINPHDQAGGGTGFPKLERNSIDAASIANESDLATSDRGNDFRPRRSIVGGEKERAEVLAAVKKGILKRTGTGTDSGNSSPVSKPIDAKVPDFGIAQPAPITESPGSSAPSTPADEQPRLGHRRTDSVTIEGEDYFLSLAKFASGDSKSMPGTPRSIAARNISFSPRIQFHDTWPSGEYDRRGEIATCNRLTPMLAQQIKEELNTFKMEMEVHEQSKVYTHFF